MSSAEHVHSVEADAGCLLTRRKNILKSWQDKVTRRWIWDRHNLFKGEAYLMVMTIKREAFWTPFLQTKTFKKKKGGWGVSGHESQKIKKKSKSRFTEITTKIEDWKSKFAIFENFTNHGESIRDLNRGSRE